MRAGLKRRVSLSIFCIILILTGGFSLKVNADGAKYGAEGPGTKARTYCVIDGDTGEVLLEKNKDQIMYPASTTKMMTALLVLEYVEDLEQLLMFTETSINIDPTSSVLPKGVGDTTPDSQKPGKAKVGEIMTVYDALAGMLLPSGNECGAMLGEFVASLVFHKNAETGEFYTVDPETGKYIYEGTEAEFASLMNERANEIGCTNTHFVNAYGIHDNNHYTTAYDLCLILRECMENEDYRKLNQTINYTIPATNLYPYERRLLMGHQLLNGTIEETGIIGGKTGRTPQAGRTLTTAALRNGFYTISALMGSDDENFYKDEQVLLEYTYGLHDGSISSPLSWGKMKEDCVVNETVRLRYSPSTKGGIVKTLEEGERVVKLGECNGWAKIKIYLEDDYYIRYVSAACLSPAPEQTTQAPVETETETEALTEPETETEEESETEEETVAESGSMEITSEPETETEVATEKTEEETEKTSTAEETGEETKEKTTETFTETDSGTTENDVSTSETEASEEEPENNGAIMIVFIIMATAIFGFWIFFLIKLFVRKENTEE